MNNNKLIIIVPCYNEQEVIVNTIRTLTNLLTNMHVAHLISDDSKILLVDDGSNDNTWKIINEESSNNPKISGIRLTRNSGQQIALMAGYAQINGLCDMAVTIDADLQKSLKWLSDIKKDTTSFMVYENLVRLTVYLNVPVHRLSIVSCKQWV